LEIKKRKKKKETYQHEDEPEGWVIVEPVSFGCKEEDGCNA